MLKTPAPFPNVGSWALLEEGGELRAVRITATVADEPGLVTVSVAGAFTASAVKRLPLAALRNADALTPEEQAELAELDGRMAGKARPKRADVARAKALGDRQTAATSLKALLDKVPDKYFPAAGEARRERAVAGAAA